MENNKTNALQEFFASVIPIVKYILKRLLYMIPVLLIMSLIIFLIVENMPGDPIWAYIDPETPMDRMPDLDLLREQLGLVGPLHERYGKWLMRVLQGDLGMSSVMRRPVVEVLPYYIKNSLLLNVFAFILAFFISIIVGIKSAVNRYSAFDNFWTVFSMFGISMPSFFMAMLLIFFFVIIIPIFPFSGMIDPRANHVVGSLPYYKDLAYHMVLPVAVTCLGLISSLVRYVRNAMLEVLKQDYIRTARSKGLKDKVVIYRHAFRNALIPVLTLVGLYVPLLFGGSVLVEKIFAWPGVGNLLNTAYTQRDSQVILALTIFYSMLTLLANLFVDVSYALVDPRVRVGDGE